MPQTDLTPREKYDRLKDACYATGDAELTEELLRELGAQEFSHPEDGFAVWFEDYGVVGAPGESWGLVHAESGSEVTAEMWDLPLHRLLRRMRSTFYLPQHPDWLR